MLDASDSFAMTFESVPTSAFRAATAAAAASFDGPEIFASAASPCNTDRLESGDVFLCHPYRSRLDHVTPEVRWGKVGAHSCENSDSPVLMRPQDDLIVDVSDILNEHHVIPAGGAEFRMRIPAVTTAAPRNIAHPK